MPECINLLQFDTVAISNNYLNQYAALQFVSRQNYDEVKKNYSASIPDYFTGGYDDFSTKRNSLSELLATAGVTEIDSNYYRHTLSEIGAKAYADCVAQTNDQILSAWVKSKTDKEITIALRNGQAGHSTVEYTIGGRHTPLGNYPTELNGGSEIDFMFDYTDKESFTVTFNGTVKQTKAQFGVTISLPAVIKLESRNERKTLTAVSQCEAGGYGNSSYRGTSDPAEFVADDGFTILPATVTRIESINNGENNMGISTREITWNTVTEKGHIVRLTGAITQIDGMNGDTRGGRKETWSVQQERVYLAKIE